MLMCFVDGTVDAVVFGTGTGGTLAGINTLIVIFLYHSVKITLKL